jgi:hypothetical protein
MDRRPVFLTMAASCFGGGMTLLGGSLAITLPPTTALFAASAGTLMVIGGGGTFGYLIATGRSAKAEAAQRKRRLDMVAKYHGQSRELLSRARKAGQDQAFDDEAQAWADGMCTELTAEFGEAQVELLQVSSGPGWRYSSKGENPSTGGLENIHRNLGQLLVRLS